MNVTGDQIPASFPVTDAEARAFASQGISGGTPHYAWTVQGLETEIARAHAILDLGCGRGYFGHYLKHRFQRRPHGIDVVRHPDFAEDSYTSFGLRNLETIEPGELRYDVVFAIGLIEFFPNPRAFVKSLPPVLAPGGKVVLTSPNPASLLNLLSLGARGEFSSFRQDCTHGSITSILAVDAVRMLREAGFTRITLDYSARGRVPFCRGLQYHKVLPFLKGRLWSDNFRIVASLK